ncbi:MAG: hypothetical protein IT368_11945, partial [Candidatus Hydrogenedentes bacterium]|nr:hypothetical protein [Candidatus Hydrogenedentota bacterium]
MHFLAEHRNHNIIAARAIQGQGTRRQPGVFNGAAHAGGRWTAQLLWSLCLAAAVFAGSGCGELADKDRLPVASVGGEVITRGDLWRVIREMDDDERPRIERKADLRRFLEQHIDEMIKIPLGEQYATQLSPEQKNLLTAQAREQFFARHPDVPYREIANIEVPESGELPPDAQVYGLTPEGILAMHDAIAIGADKINARLLGNAAVAKLAIDNYRAGKLPVSDEALQQEYNLRKDTLRTLEWIEFIGVRFPADDPAAQEKAAALRRRIDEGVSFDTIVEEYRQSNPDQLVISEIENNPSLSRFASFWLNASGTEAGGIVGPVYMPEYSQTVQTSDGRQMSATMPAAYLVLKVLQHRPERVMTLDEARDQLVPPVAFAEQMELLRDQAG